MKKLLAVILALLTVICLFSACSGKDDKGGDTKEAEVTEALTEGDYTYEILGDDTVKITGFTGGQIADRLEIPDTIAEKNVTVIGEKAFAQSDKLVYVVMPKHIVKIENDAFKGSSIKNAMMTSSRELVSIGDEAFADCAKLVQVDIPNSVESIGKGAFKNAAALMVFTMRGDTALTPELFEGARKFVIWGYEEAANAAKFAKDNGYEFKTLSRG